MEQPTTTTQDPAANLAHPTSLKCYNLPMRAWLENNGKATELDGLATSALVFDRRGRVLLLQRAAHDSMPLRWEAPGGAVDDADPSVLAACARELREETGLGAVRVVRVVSEGAGKEPGSSLTNRTGTLTLLRFAFEVEVEVEAVAPGGDGEGDEIAVRTDPEEHADHVWASEEEVMRERVGEKDIPITNAQMASLILDGFRRRREEGVV
ncbi:NUDIX domain-containing protein [Colletotrichum graminicola]|uniref:NUDIX domain-containing protein n=1 Tax=Colletotrichum graminicola (strain M1.001 / M2 / FGSC 10212) TaxID=645133 RepID=E3Q2M0_COLGM|nr:NUDIX domain-containing protein [Colletotrichum graminicola M1.001]EFQ25321.1 NUDIX domain-containing protein [Colletotrichum graminicola M1.001]WDK15011.1 NUDIX domain-containing protein [Colletotrichum graminicola]